MTNNTIMSRRACVEKITILPDGTIPPVEMTSLGFEEALNPYAIIPAEIACVLTGGCFITEKDAFTRVVTSIRQKNVIGYKYFDFGTDYHGDGLTLALKTLGAGANCKVHVYIDDYPDRDPDNFHGTEIGVIDVGTGDGVYKGKMQLVTGRHSLFLVPDHGVSGWIAPGFDSKPLFELKELTFMK